MLWKYILLSYMAVVSKYYNIIRQIIRYCRYCSIIRWIQCYANSVTFHEYELSAKAFVCRREIISLRCWLATHFNFFRRRNYTPRWLRRRHAAFSVSRKMFDDLTTTYGNVATTQRQLCHLSCSCYSCMVQPSTHMFRI